MIRTFLKLNYLFSFAFLKGNRIYINVKVKPGSKKTSLLSIGK